MMAEFHLPTTKLWLIYMNMVLILKRYIHADRTCLRAEHLTEVENMLPNLVAAGRCKYSKYPACQLQYLEAMGGQPALALKKTEGIPGWIIHCESGTEPHRTKSHRTKSLRTKSHKTKSHRTEFHNMKSGKNPTI